MASQLEQLLTCCICLDRFRNPKLLPCQHSVCMEPCMEGLVDYVRRQVKCPECRAEHRIPYNGVQGFPSNVTLQRFLEAHIEITGEAPDPHTGQIMERCGVCNEKNYLTTCTHCEKKICADCKAAHNDILKREIGRINNQVKRAVHRLGDQLTIVERNISALKQNSDSVKEEIENISKRLSKAIRDRSEFLKTEVINYYNTEHRHLTVLKEGLEQEISNVESNSDLADKHMDDRTPWDDNELMDTKDIFLKTVEFIRSFDYESGDYNRRARFNAPDDINKLASNLSTLGDLAIHNPKQTLEGFNQGGSSIQSGLMKSKSDHRLAAQFRDQDEGGYGYGSGGRTSPVSRRRFGDRPPVVEEASYESPNDVGGRRRFRSRFMRRGEEEEEKSVRFNDEDGQQAKLRPKVIDTEDASRGPLSGITRIIDSPRVIQRLQEKEGKFKKKEEAPKPLTPTPKATPVTFGTPRKAARQVSEDEIDKIKKQNKNETTASSTSSSTTPKPSFERLSSIKDNERSSRTGDRNASTSPRSGTMSPSAASAHEDEPSRRTSKDHGNRFDFAAANASSTTTATPTRKTSVDSRTYPFSRSSSTSSVGENGKTTGPKSPKTSETTNGSERRPSRSDSADSNKSAEDRLKKNGTDTKTTTPAPAAAAATSKHGSRFLNRAGTPSAETAKEPGNDEEEEESSEESESEESEESSEEEEEEDKSKSSVSSRPGASLSLGRSANQNDSGYGSSTSRYGSGSNSNDSASASSRYGSASSNDTSSRYGTVVNSNDTSGRYGTPVTSNDTSSRYGTTVNSNDTSSRYGTTVNSNDRYGTVVNSNDTSSRYGTTVNSNDTSGRYGTTVNSNDTSMIYKRSPYLDSSKTSKETSEDLDSKYPYASKFLNRNRAAAATEEETKPSFQSRFLNKSKSSAVLGPDASNDDDSHSTSVTGSSRAKFDELKERRQRLARSKSSAGLEEEDSSPTADSPSTTSSYRNRYGRDSDTTSAASNRASNSASSAAGAEDAPANQLSNWARYLKNKYGNKTTTATPPSAASSASSSGASSSVLGKTSTSTSSPSARSIARSRSSHLLGLAKENDSLEDDSKNVHATPTSPAAVGTLGHTPFGSIHRSQYLQKQKVLFKIGSRGSDAGHFTWPRGVAVGPDDSIVVADSSNHRVQVFKANGDYLKDFGAYGNGEGEFDCLAGVAVNRIGQYIIADRYNHRIQIFDPSGMFLRSFGSQGSGDGKFAYPWGVTTDSLGFIYICDKENHRIQVFQSDGTFVGKFGSLGSKLGQLEHPHYIAVSSTNKVVVSDSNNHRVQIFDVNGKVLTAFGAEGSDDGQFKFPRGVAVDEQGYIFVADSGNNRIQIFHPDGAFLRAFGCWGSSDGEFKGLEGVGVTSNGSILICDRENHRVQVF